jgi:hypothetical protein
MYNESGDNHKISRLNDEFDAIDRSKKIRIGIIYCGRQAPGGNNVVDGLLRFAKVRGNTEIIGFLNGTKGFFKGEVFYILNF